MADKKIYEFPVKETPADVDGIIISNSEDGGWDAQVSVKDMANHILGGRGFGGSGEIVTADASAQTMSNKRIDNPKINDATPISVSGAQINKLGNWDGAASDINKLTGIATTKADLANCSGTAGNLQQQINGISFPITDRIFTYILETTAITALISDADLLSASGEGNFFVINHQSITIGVFRSTGTHTYDYLDKSNNPPAIVLTTKTVRGQKQLSNISVSYGQSEDMIITIRYQLMERTGV